MEYPEDSNQERPELWRRLASTAMDLVPGVGQIKLVQEAVRGRTADGFELNNFERWAYVGSAALAITTSGTALWAVHAKNLEEGALSGAAFVGSWVCFGLGKARQCGFSVPDSVKSAFWSFVKNEDSGG